MRKQEQIHLKDMEPVNTSRQRDGMIYVIPFKAIFMPQAYFFTSWRQNHFPYDFIEGNEKEAHLYETPKPIRMYNKSISPSLESVIIRMIAKPLQERFSNWEEIIDCLKMDDDCDTDSLLSSAISKRLKGDEEKSKKELMLQKKQEEIEAFDKRVYSQFNSQIREPIISFVKEFNNGYHGTSKITVDNNFCRNEKDKLFLYTDRIGLMKIEFRPVFPMSYVQQGDLSTIYENRDPEELLNDGRYRYTPTCNGREICGWGKIEAFTGEGYNILLLKSKHSHYGDWVLMTNTESAFGRGERPVEPFAFSFDELQREIVHINAIHTYNNIIEKFEIDSIKKKMIDWM